jgi:hypothetical protein
MATLKTGRFKAKGIKGSGQWGLSGEKETPQVAVDLSIKINDTDFVSGTTFLYFSIDAAPYSFERLTALGWKGKGPADLGNLAGIDENVVDVDVREEEYKGKPQMKIEILTGAGKVTLAKPMDPATFAQRVTALLGNGVPASTGGGGGVPAPGLGTVKPPF